MQIKEQWKGSKNWKLVTGVATAATLGLGAIAVAAPGSNEVPEAINLNDRAIVSDDSFRTNPDGFVAFDDFSIDDTTQDSGDVSPQADISAQVSTDLSPQDSVDVSVDDTISAQDSLDVSPQTSIDDSISAQDESPDDSVSEDSIDDSVSDDSDDSA